MKYYISNSYGFRTEVTSQEFFSKRRRKDAHESICYQNGCRSSRTLKFY